LRIADLLMIGDFTAIVDLLPIGDCRLAMATANGEWRPQS
jgi:hypothetical protein